MTPALVRGLGGNDGPGPLSNPAPGIPLAASRRAVLRQGVLAPARKNTEDFFSGVVVVVVVILLVHAIPETCAEGFSWSTPQVRRNLFLRRSNMAQAERDAASDWPPPTAMTVRASPRVRWEGGS